MAITKEQRRVASDAMLTLDLLPVSAIASDSDQDIVVSHYLARAWNTSTWAHAALAVIPDMRERDLLKLIFYRLQGERALADEAARIVPMSTLRPLGNRWRRPLRDVVAEAHSVATADEVVASVRTLPYTFDAVIRAALTDDAVMATWMT